jgi:hypothetical protein
VCLRHGTIKPHHSEIRDIEPTCSGSSYSDDLSADEAIYDHPKTQRPPDRDLSEINCTKAPGDAIQQSFA